MLNQCVRDSGQPCAVFDLPQQFERDKKFNAVGWRPAQASAKPAKPGLAIRLKAAMLGKRMMAASSAKVMKAAPA
jgi:hypothetical protein